MMAELIILLVGVVVSALIGAFVLMRNPKNSVNRLYAGLTLALIMFPVANYLSLHQIENSLWYIRAVLFFTSIAVALLYLLIIYIGDQKHVLGKFEKVGLVLTGFVALSTLTPIVFSGVNISSQGQLTPTPAPGASIYFIQFVAYLALCFAALIRKLRSAKGIQKIQYMYLLIGITPIVLFAPLTAFIMPVVYKNSSLISLSPIYATFFVALVGYSIVRHRLFDVRATIARSMGYLLSVLFIAIIYGFLVITIAQKLFGFEVPINSIIFLSVLTGITGLLAPYLSSRFSRLTSSIFYKDAYDPQEVINKVNSNLVNTVKLEQILTNTAQILIEDLKVEFAEFYLQPSASIQFHLVGSNSKLFSSPEWPIFLSLIEKNNEKIQPVISSQNEIDVSEAMKKLGVECAVQMIVNEQKVGVLMVGERKSGNVLSDQDTQLLEIIADEVAIAAQNALRFEEISQFANTLQARVEEATRELQRSNEKLQKLDEAKDEFISMASHQLRTPLTSVKGYISMLLEGDAGDINETQKRFLDQAFLSSQRMVYLIADLLNVSRLKTGKFVIETHPTYLPDVVESEIRQLYETAKARELELVFDKPESFATINLDETKIRQVIMNFADNAIYYTPRGGRITVALKELKESIEYTVTDTGIGVPKKEQHRLFTKFYRAGNAKKARPDGTGLGLYMAKKVVVAQGGSIIYKTEEGKGSTFGFSFPIPKEVE